MISQFFITRPKFAFVISLVITLVGGIALFLLPVAQFPNIVPPVVTISCTYPGASAEVVEESVLRPIEEKINGVEGMLYISSSATNEGTASIAVTFAVGTDQDIAQVNVQNRVAQAESSLPEDVRRLGVVVDKASTSMLLGFSLYSPDNTRDQLFLSNYAMQRLVEPLQRIPGVAKVDVTGNMAYSMRIWLNPDRMASLGITTMDVQQALQEQNAIAPAGKLGAAPSIAAQQFEYTIRTRGRLDTEEEFGNVVLRATPGGSIVRLKDIARIELGSESYSASAKLNGAAQAFIIIYQASDANALDVAEQTTAVMEALGNEFPDGMKWTIPFDSTRFITRSIDEVVVTLFEAVSLVIIVVFIFLQSWRATLIPAIAIPVSLIGTFAVMLVLGYSINTISLFGIVLAIGVVVDDAIVVIENVERLMETEGLSPADATHKAMQEVTGPVIATTLVLLAVFVPVAFMPGITGGLYKQFAVTISVAVLISSINALTLSPALCVTILKSDKMEKLRFMRPVEKVLAWLTERYGMLIGSLLRKGLLCGAVTAAVFLAAGWMFMRTPTGFIPNEDQGFFLVDMQLPDAASLVRTESAIAEMGKVLEGIDGIRNVVAISGNSMLAGYGASVGMIICELTDWEERQTPDLHQDAIIRKAQGALWSLPGAQARAFAFPPIPGLGTAGGFEFQLQDTVSRSPQELASVARGLSYNANQRPELTRVFNTFQASVPQFTLEVDRNKAKVLGIPLSEVFLTLQTQLGSLYVNDFARFGRLYQVKMQAEGEFRAKPSDISRFYVRNLSGEMVPLSTVARFTPTQGPSQITRYNLFRSVKITGQPETGFSSGDAIATMDSLGKQLPSGYTYEWTGQSKQEIEAGNVAPVLFGLALLFVYLFLVAQYESWTLPVAIIASVPLAMFGAIGGITLFGPIYMLDNNIYAQVGMVLLIGIAAKTSILIVEFAMELRKSGKSPLEAAHEAAKLRFRAVQMTALSFILGVFPMVVASGPGAASRHALGVTVCFGMIAATIFSPLLVPSFYLWLQTLRERVGGPGKAKR